MTGSRLHFLINDSGCHVQDSAGVLQEGRESCYNHVGVGGNRQLRGSDSAVDSVRGCTGPILLEAVVLLSLCADASPCQISVAFSSLPSLYQPQGCWTRSPVPWLVQADHSENHGMTARWALTSFQLTDDLCQELRRVHFVT